MRVVLKLGGRVAGDSIGLALDRHAAGDEVVVVHGAGTQITSELRASGIATRFVAGRRFTDQATLAIVRRSLVAVGTELSAALGSAALHLVGDEIGLAATRVPELGLVGEPLPCRPAAVEEAFAARRIPIVTPIGCPSRSTAPRSSCVASRRVRGPISAALPSRSTSTSASA